MKLLFADFALKSERIRSFAAARTTRCSANETFSSSCDRFALETSAFARTPNSLIRLVALSDCTEAIFLTRSQRPAP